MICWIDTNADFLSVSLFPKSYPCKLGSFLFLPPTSQTKLTSCPVHRSLASPSTFSRSHSLMAASKRPTLGFFQVLDQGAKHESPFTVFFWWIIFFETHSSPHPPKKMMESQGAIFFRKHFTTKYTGGKKKQQHHFQKCEPWRLLTKFICGELTLLRNDTSSSPLRSSHWGCRGHPTSWRLRIPKVLRRWEKNYSIIHFRRMIDVKICLQNLTKHWHRFRCQMAYISKYIWHQL